jgi:hypothetical protein
MGEIWQKKARVNHSYVVGPNAGMALNGFGSSFQPASPALKWPSGRYCRIVRMINRQ